MKKEAKPYPKPPIENITAHRMTVKTPVEYSVFLPKGYGDSARKKWPLLIFLHGSGERGTQLWRTSIHGPTQYIAKHPEFPFVLVTPMCQPGHKWSDELVLGVLDQVVQDYSVDTNRVYLTGLSMGGYGTWSLATTHPERFAAVAPICGGEGMIGEILTMIDLVKAPAFKSLPVWAFHGKKDTTVPWDESDRMVKLFRSKGNQDVKLTTYPEANHNSWTVTYDNPELYEWFLEHDLKSRVAKK